MQTTTRASQLTITELIDALEAKIAAMRARDGGHPADMPENWKTERRARPNGRPRANRTHPFSNIEEL